MSTSRSRSPTDKKRKSRSPSDRRRKSRSPRSRRRQRSSSSSDGRRRRRRSTSRGSGSPGYPKSPSPVRRHRYMDRENPPPSNVLGVFGLSYNTDEYDLEREFGRFGTLDNIRIVRDPERRSRGFGFIDFKRLEDAKEARRALCDKILDGKKIRVDFSLTKEPHGRTPGQYLGNGRWSRSPDHGSRHRRRSRSYSPRRY